MCLTKKANRPVIAKTMPKYKESIIFFFNSEGPVGQVAISKGRS